MPSLEERARYQPDLGVAWSLLPLLIVGALATAAAVAWVFKFAYFHNWYLLMLLPMLGGIALGGVLYALVGLAHCRNRWLAGALGAVAGLTAFLGYYQLCLGKHMPGLGGRVDLLPQYIAARMRTDVAEDIAKANPGQQPRKPFVPLNWFYFGLELLLVTGIATVCAAVRAGRAYCRELGQWMRRETALLPPGCGPAFREALESGKLPEFLARTPAWGNPQAACALSLEYAAPADGSPLQHPIYMTLMDGAAAKSGPKRRGPAALRQVELEPDEVLALRPLFPQLTQLLAARHQSLRDQPAEVVTAQLAEAPAAEVAEITPVPEPFRQRVHSRYYALIVNLHGLIPLVYFLGGGGLLVWGVWLALEGSVAPGCAVAVVGLAGFAWGIYTAYYCLTVYENRWINRRLRREVRQRPDAWVDPDSPESVYVSLIPRESFAKIKWTLSSDLLLLKIDERGRQLLMEGDCDRYRIPAGAITACEPQCFFHPIDPQHNNELWMVRLMIQTEPGLRELLLGVANTGWAPMTNARRRAVAEAMCRRINALRA